MVLGIETGCCGRGVGICQSEVTGQVRGWCHIREVCGVREAVHCWLGGGGHSPLEVVMKCCWCVAHSCASNWRLLRLRLLTVVPQKFVSVCCWLRVVLCIMSYLCPLLVTGMAMLSLHIRWTEYMCVCACVKNVSGRDCYCIIRKLCQNFATIFDIAYLKK